MGDIEFNEEKSVNILKIVDKKIVDEEFIIVKKLVLLNRSIIKYILNWYCSKDFLFIIDIRVWIKNIFESFLFVNIMW